MNFKLLSYLLLFSLLLIPNAMSNWYADYYFCDEQDQMVTDVEIIGWRCQPRDIVFSPLGS